MIDHIASSQPAVPSIPLFGQSWFTRNTTYIVKRALISLILALVLAMCIVFIWAVVATIVDKSGSWVRVVLLLGVFAGITWSHYVAFRQLYGPKADSTAGGSEASSLPTSEGITTGVVAYGGSAIAGGLILVGQVFVVGWITANFTRSLRRYVSSFEVQAVDQMRDWYREHPEVPNTQRPRQFRR